MLELANINHSLTMTTREIADLIGKSHFHVMRDVRSLQSKLEPEGLFGGSIQNWIHPQNGQEYEEFLLDKETCLTLLLGYDAVARMKVVKRWQELESEKPTSAMPALPSPAVEAMQFAEAAANMLRLEGSARLGLARSVTTIVAPHLLPALPVYAIDAPAGSTTGSSEPTASLTTLLKEGNVAISTMKANKVLESLRLITERSRVSRGHIVKRYWSVTESGLRYGKNVTSERNQRETQPHWFIRTADELIRLIEENA